MERERFRHTFESEAILVSEYFKYVTSADFLILDPEDTVMLDEDFIHFARSVVAASESSWRAKNLRNSVFGTRSNSNELEITFLLMIYFT